MCQRVGLYDVAVPVDEVAFAMTLFVEAANLKIPGKRSGLRSLPMQEFGKVFDTVTAEISGAIAAHAVAVGLPPSECTIEFPFQMMWQHYEGDGRRASICARVLGFHSLMLQTNGALVESWLRPCPHSAESVILDPIVVEAVALTPLGRDGVMTSAEFTATLTRLAMKASLALAK